MELRIKNYLSWSQLSLFERSPEEYRRVYILGEKGFENAEMRLGSRIASGLEKDDELSGDGLVDFCKMSLPSVDQKEKELRVKWSDMELLVRMDGFVNPNVIYEYKTGHSAWTQKKVDSWGQLTFYAFVFYLATGTMPELNLIWIPTKKENGEIKLTGEKPVLFKTKRTMSDFAKLSVRLKRAWIGIGEMVKEEALK